MSDLTHTPVGEFVSRDFRTAAVFQRHGIDFCCGGRRPLDQACAEAGVDPAPILTELDTVLAMPGNPDQPPSDLRTLMDLILDRHHAYIRDMNPVIRAHAHKVAEVHGGRHPETRTVAMLFDAVADELEAHLLKEERILFPAILDLLSGQETSMSISAPIAVMESEHVGAGTAFEDMRTATDQFTLPEDACTTYTVLYRELEAFEADLHRHIHLENNILFPAALELERTRA